jgi:putative MFS transporter
MLTQIETKPLKVVPQAPELKISELVMILLVAGMGFFVDVYDLAVFSVVRVASFVGIGVPTAQLFSTGVFILNMQMVGMVVGGFLWGILGDKKGRKFTLFGSICLYSVATFLNGFVNSVAAYAVLRFLAGIGLAGEVGAAIIIVAEVTPTKYRGYATGAVRALGLLGAVLACLIGDRLPWRMVYITAGLAGMLLLLARMSIKETNLFLQLLHDKEAKRGSIGLFLSDSKRAFRLIRCFMAGMPIWFFYGVLISFAPEICRDFGRGAVVVTVGAACLWASCGQALGEALSGIFSQMTRSRKVSMLCFVAAAGISTVVLLRNSAQHYVLLAVPIGFFMGYCSVLLTTTAEQFGTNLRSTATTLVPNFIRASAIPVTLLFSGLVSNYGTVNSAMITGGLCFAIALISIAFMDETFDKPLNFIER